ncbi:MAG: acyltransferase family protein [Candidatus Eisenbacteria bacterium]
MTRATHRPGPAKRSSRHVERADSRSVPAAPLGYRPALDGVRAIAAMAVMSWHYVVPGVKGGFLGVDVFFTLSGFLITSLLVEEWSTTGAVRLSRFYGRRFLRLIPAVIVVLAVSAPFVPWSWTVLALCYAANWGVITGHFGVSPIRHLWSLSVEEQFYIVWPILLVILLRARAPRRWFYAVVALLALASTTFKIVAWRSPADWVRLFHGSDGRADQLWIGCGLGLFLSWSTVAGRRGFRSLVRVVVIPAIVFLGYLFVNAAVYWEFFYRDAGFALVALATAIVLLHLMTAPYRWLAAILEWRPLVAIGRISYGLYLWHQPVGWFTDPRRFALFATAPRYGIMAARVILAFALAGASWFVIERPMRRLRQRFEPVGRRPGATVEEARVPRRRTGAHVDPVSAATPVRHEQLARARDGARTARGSGREPVR